MKIAFITLENPFSTTSNGGIGTYTGIIAKGMAESGHKVYIITQSPNESEIKIQKNLQLICISMPQTKYNTDLEQMQQIYFKVLTLHKKIQLDLIECHEWFAPGAIVVQELNIPFVTRLHTPLFLIQDIHGVECMYKNSLRICENERLQTYYSDLITVPCKSLKEIVEEKWNIQSIVIPNPINSKAYVGLKTNNCTTDKYLLYIGRLEYRKGVLHYAKALKKAFENDSSFKMYFCGTDSFYKRRSVKKEIIEICSGFDDRLVFINHANEAMKKELISNCVAFVVPSLWENFPYTLLEAMSYDKTVLASDCGGLSEIIEHGKSGFLIGAYDTNEWTQYILRAANYTLETKGSVFQRVDDYCSLEVLIPKYEELYQSLL